MLRIVLLIGVFQSLFYAFLLAQKKKKALHHIILMIWLLFLGVLISVYVFYSEDLFTQYPHLINSYFSLLLLHGPFLYLYVKSLISDKAKVINRYTLLHLTPLIFFNLYLVLAFHFSRIADNIQLDYVNSDISPPVIYVIFLLLIVLSGPFYFIWTIGLLHGHGIKLLQRYSSIENLDLSWLRYLIWVFGIAWTALLFFAFVHHVMFLYTRDFCTNGLFLSLAAFILLIGYFGLKQSVIVSTKDNMSSKQNKDEDKIRYSGSLLKEEVAKQYLRKLEQCMEKDKPYLNETITLHQLAEKLEIPVHYLSQIINEHYNHNFFDYINVHRVEEIKKKIVDPKFENYSLLGIALDTGFNSKTAFNRVFKKFEGKTPSQFKRMINS